MGKARLASVLALALTLAMGGCAGLGETPGATSAEPGTALQESESSTGEPDTAPQPGDTGDVREDAGNDGGVVEMRMSIGGTNVSVEWEDNQAVADLEALAAEGPVTVGLSMYGGFEQVGPLGTHLSSSDEQMTTAPGDIVLYAGNQISVFYGSNSWAYTRLGHITDKTADELADLLGNGNTVMTITIQ